MRAVCALLLIFSKLINMKPLPISALALLLLFIPHCKKESEPTLPPETTTGAMTFGCKVNGNVFVPKDHNGRPGLFVQYIQMTDGWHLNIPAVDWETLKGVSITTDSLFLQVGQKYEFDTVKGTAQAFYVDDSQYNKLPEDSGHLLVKYLDLSNRILSGTFSFVGTNKDGRKVSITDGRFDVKF